MNDLLDFFDLVEKLKITPRTGWVRCGLPVDQVESISDHMYRMSMMAMTLPDDVQLVGGDGTRLAIDRHRCHAMQRIRTLVSAVAPHAADEMATLWREYEDLTTIESMVVHDLDKFEMVVQAAAYERRFPERRSALATFFESTRGIMKTTVVAGWDAAVRARRVIVDGQPGSDSESV